MALSLGLAAALLWGVADFLIRVVGRRLGVHRAMVYAQGFGAVAIGVAVAADPAALSRALSAPWPAWAAALGAAPIGLGGTVAIYRAFAVGRVGLVSPIVGAYGAVTAALSLASGETLGAIGIAGMGAATLGVVLVSWPAGEARGWAPGGAPARAHDLGGLGYALLACLGFGVQFWIQGRYAVPGLGAALPVWIYYIVSSLVLGTTARAWGTTLRLSRSSVPIVLATGASAVGGYLVLSAGMATGQVAVVTVLSSLQSPVTVGLAAWFLGERLARHQALGVAAIVAGLALIRAG